MKQAYIICPNPKCETGVTKLQEDVGLRYILYICPECGTEIRIPKKGTESEKGDEE